MQIEGLVHSIVNQAGAKAVYGEPISVDGKTIVPVARIRYGFGGGSGSKAGEKQEQGFGGGCGFSGDPIGVVEITRESTRFVPIGDRRKVAFAMAVGIWLGLLIARKRRRARTDATK
jgi:uncharacterized spore protein YtfJ